MIILAPVVIGGEFRPMRLPLQNPILDRPLTDDKNVAIKKFRVSLCGFHKMGINRCGMLLGKRPSVIDYGQAAIRQALHNFILHVHRAHSPINFQRIRIG